MNDKRQLIASIPLFATLPGSKLKEVARSSDVISVPAGTTIVAEGTFTREICFLTSGSATVVRDGEPIATLSQGDYFGELSLIDGQPRSASVVADTDVELLIVNKREFNALLETCPPVARELMVGMSARLREQPLPLG